MQGSVETFFKAFDELKRTHTNIELNFTYKTYYVLELIINNKVLFNLKGQDTGILFDNAAAKLVNYLRE